VVCIAVASRLGGDLLGVGNIEAGVGSPAEGAKTSKRVLMLGVLVGLLRVNSD
jgi:hypothetical protein